MKTLVVVPVKHFEESKRRLSIILSTEERIVLAQTMLLDVLNAINRSKYDFSIALFAQDNQQVHQILRGKQYNKKLYIFHDTTSNLNETIYTASQWAKRNNFSAILVVPIDVPLIKSIDIDRIIERSLYINKGIVIASSYNGGTNLLLLKPPTVMPTFYGSNSFLKHITYADTHGLEVVEYISDRVRLDIDTPLDLLVFFEQGISTATHNYLQTIGIHNRFSIIVPSFSLSSSNK